MPDFLKDKQDEISKRIDQLRPAVEEHARLEAALKALAAVPGFSSNATPRPSGGRRRRPGRPRVARTTANAKAAASTTASPRASRPATAARPGRRRGSGKRAQQALSLIRQEPGIGIPALAAKMKIKPNYLYRVLPALGEEGKVRKDGKGWRST